MFATVVIILFIISFLWSIWSLRGFNKNQKVTKKIKKELSKGRVVYQNPGKKI